jgi:hypothetical protein
MDDIVQVKGLLERHAKRRFFATLALREQRFTQWLREQSERWTREMGGELSASPAAQASAGAPAPSVDDVPVPGAADAWPDE